MRYAHVLLLLVAGAACTSLKAATDAEGTLPGDGTKADASPDAVDGAPEDSRNEDAGPTDSGSDAPADSAVCTEATCAPEVVVDGLYGPVSMAVDATHLYWVEVGSTIPNGGRWGQLVRIPKNGGCKARSCFDVLDYTVLTGQLEGQYIYGARVAVGPTDVCFTQSYNAAAQHSIYCFALANPTRRVLDQGAGSVVDLWVGAADARWAIASTVAGGSDGAIGTRPLQGGTSGRIATNLRDPTAVVSNGSETYWTEWRGGAKSTDGTVEKALPDGGTTTLAGGRAGPLAARLFGSHVYWIDAAARRVMRVRTDGVGGAEQVSTTAENPIEMVVDGSGVYVAALGPGTNAIYSSVSHSPTEPGGAVTVMLSNLNNLYGVAVDATRVYATTVGAKIEDGRILRIAKTR